MKMASCPRRAREAIHESRPSLADSIIRVQEIECGKCGTFPYLMPVTAREPAACIGDKERRVRGLEVHVFGSPDLHNHVLEAASSVAEARRITPLAA
jgi:hypothetical protein